MQADALTLGGYSPGQVQTEVGCREQAPVTAHINVQTCER